MNIAQNLWKANQHIPDQIALTLLYNRLPEQSITYQELFQKSQKYAVSLAQLGVEPGRVVILILQHGPDLIYAFFGAILLGAIPSIMPFLTEKLLPDQYRASLESLLEIITPAAIVTYPEFAQEVSFSLQRTSIPPKLLISNQVGSEDQANKMTILPGLNVSESEIVLLQHSSGTTGLQKGVALTHKAVFNQLNSYAKALHLDPDDVVISWLPLYHDMGLIAGFIMPILFRNHLVIMSPFDWVRSPGRLFQAISQYHGTLCWLPNFAYNFCAQKIRAADLENIDLSSLRAVINCSEPIYEDSHQVFLQRFQPYGLRPTALATCYAMAENVFAVTQGGIHTPIVIDTIDGSLLSQKQIAQPISAEASPNSIIRMVSCGKPVQGTEIKIVDEHGETVPNRHLGEVAIKSNCMLSGYFNRPDLTQSAFLNGWYLTGDLGYLANGELFITGRKKDLIIVGGKNIYPQDLERLAGTVEMVHPGRVVAFGVFNSAIGTEDVVIIAEIDHYSSLSDNELDDIASEIRQVVTQGSDITLRKVHLVNRNWLLKTSSGKISRSANREKYLREIT